MESKFIFIIVSFFAFNCTAIAQVGINTNTPDPSAVLDMVSTNKGMLVPRMTTNQRTTISSPANGLLVYDETSSSFWFYNGSVWKNLSAVTTSDHIADADNDTRIQVEQSADEDIIRFDLGGTEYFRMNSGRFQFENTSNNMAIGSDLTLNSLTTGVENVAIGAGALSNISSGQKNVALGINSGASTTGSGNVFLGHEAGYSETGSNKLYIENSNSTTPLIYGEFDNNFVKINGSALIDKLGINMLIPPTAEFQVAGNFILGLGGSTLKEIIKLGVAKDVGSISSNNVLNVDFTVPGAETGSSVSISPSGDLPGSVFIGQTRVSSANTVRVRFLNEGSSNKNPVNMTYYITVIK